MGGLDFFSEDYWVKEHIDSEEAYKKAKIQTAKVKKQFSDLDGLFALNGRTAPDSIYYPAAAADMSGLPARARRGRDKSCSISFCRFSANCS